MCLLLSVWAKLKSQKALERWQPDTEVSAAGGSGQPRLNRCREATRSCCPPPVCVFQEEYEDSSGNVVNKKTYEDLKRQGLL